MARKGFSACPGLAPPASVVPRTVPDEYTGVRAKDRQRAEASGLWDLQLVPWWKNPGEPDLLLDKA